MNQNQILEIIGKEIDWQGHKIKYTLLDTAFEKKAKIISEAKPGYVDDNKLKGIQTRQASIERELGYLEAYLESNIGEIEGKAYPGINKGKYNGLTDSEIAFGAPIDERLLGRIIEVEKNLKARKDEIQDTLDFVKNMDTQDEAFEFQINSDTAEGTIWTYKLPINAMRVTFGFKINGTVMQMDDGASFGSGFAGFSDGSYVWSGTNTGELIGGLLGYRELPPSSVNNNIGTCILYVKNEDTDINGIKEFANRGPNDYIRVYHRPNGVAQHDANFQISRTASGREVTYSIKLCKININTSYTGFIGHIGKYANVEEYKSVSKATCKLIEMHTGRDLAYNN